MKRSNYRDIERKRLSKIKQEFKRVIGDLSDEENAIIRANVRAGNINNGQTHRDKIERTRQIAHLIRGYRRYKVQADKEGVTIDALAGRHRAAINRIMEKVKSKEEKQKAYEQEAETKTDARPEEDGGEGAEGGRDAAGESTEPKE